MRGMALDNLFLPQSSSFFALYVIRGSLVSAVAYFSSLNARDTVNFNRFARFWSLELFENLRDRVTFP